MARVNFNSIFNRNENGTIEPRQRTRIGGVVVGPGVFFTPGVSFAGVDFSLYTENDFEIETDGDIIVVKGIYGR